MELMATRLFLSHEGKLEISLENSTEPGEMAQLVNCLLHKYEDLSLT